MTASFKNTFNIPFLEDADKARVRGILNIILWMLLGASIIGMVFQGMLADSRGRLFQLLTGGGEILIFSYALFLCQRGYIRTTAILTMIGVFVFAIIPIISYGNLLLGPGMIAVVLVPIIASFLFSGPGVILITFFVLATLAGIYIAIDNQWLQAQLTVPTTASALLYYCLILIITGVALALSSNSLRNILLRTRDSERNLDESNAKLQNLQQELELRVTERTRDQERRTIEIQTAAQIARDVSTARNLDDLLNRSARLICERFGFYHVGIFLIDEQGAFAVLRAAGGEAGQLMLAHGHRLKIGEAGLVGYVTQTGNPRIALDAGKDDAFFRDPLLPYTRSEIVLPLKVGDRIIGALDGQSEKVGAFSQENIDTLQVLTDQLAIAIEKTRLVQELEQAISEMETTSQEFTSRTWRDFLNRTRQHQGYRYEGTKTEPIAAPPAGSTEALAQGITIIVKDETGRGENFLTVPIKLRGQALGTLNLRFKSPEIPQETIQLIEEAANRLALALENARLVQDAQRLATREKQVNVIKAQVQRSADMETVLQNAIRELGNALGVPKTFIRIGLTPPVEEGEKTGQIES